jgi:hypothetical protein
LGQRGFRSERSPRFLTTGILNLPTQNLASGQYFVLIYQGEQIVQKQAIEIIH